MNLHPMTLMNIVSITSGAQAAQAKPLSKRTRQSVSDSDDDLNQEIDVVADVVAAKS